MTKEFSLSQWLGTYSLSWMGGFALTIVTAIGASWAYRVPLYQVADVTIAAQAFLVLVFEGLFAVLGVALLFTRQFGMLLKLLAVMVIYSFAIFSSAMAIQLCAWIVHMQPPLIEQSRIYRMVLHAFGTALQPFLHAAADPDARAQMTAKVGPFISTTSAILGIVGFFLKRGGQESAPARAPAH